MQIGIHSHTLVSENPEVIDGYFENYAAQMNRIGSSRGWSAYTKMQYKAAEARRSISIGNSDEVAEKSIW